MIGTILIVIWATVGNLIGLDINFIASMKRRKEREKAIHISD
jgi:hypothetical protein